MLTPFWVAFPGMLSLTWPVLIAEGLFLSADYLLGLSACYSYLILNVVFMSIADSSAPTLSASPS